MKHHTDNLDDILESVTKSSIFWKTFSHIYTLCVHNEQDSIQSSFTNLTLYNGISFVLMFPCLKCHPNLANASDVYKQSCRNMLLLL